MAIRKMEPKIWKPPETTHQAAPVEGVAVDAPADEIEPITAQMELNDEVGDALKYLAVAVQQFGEYLIANLHPNKRPRGRTLLSSPDGKPAPKADASISVKIAHQAERLKALLGYIQKEA